MGYNQRCHTQETRLIEYSQAELKYCTNIPTLRSCTDYQNTQYSTKLSLCAKSDSTFAKRPVYSKYIRQKLQQASKKDVIWLPLAKLLHHTWSTLECNRSWGRGIEDHWIIVLDADGIYEWDLTVRATSVICGCSLLTITYDSLQIWMEVIGKVISIADFSSNTTVKGGISDEWGKPRTRVLLSQRRGNLCEWDFHSILPM